MTSIQANADQLFEWIARRRDRLRKWGLALAFLVFASGLAWSLQSIPDLGARVRLAPLLLLLVIGAPIGTLLNSVEMYAISRIAGGPMTWRTSFELTVYTSAANMLPMPGGALAKLAAMKVHGVGYGRGSAMILLSSAVWGGLAFLYSGGALFWLGQERIASVFATLGLALLALGGFGFAHFAKPRLVAVVALMRIISFPLEAFRYMLALTAVGASVGFLQASIFVIASFISSAVVFAPSGLGVGESAAALLSSLIGIGAALGFIAATLGRVVRLFGLSLIVGALLLINGRKGARGHPLAAGA
ncbi:lysylphosphatidylglycerol synthase domain-containing protein [Sphingosinicella sp. CPCC 101087]|uniref:lysylphosphatidylglycerol synthase domain-containing protein n=1 Tax=Sphingosinicella sp. CPCC 101087 TaxID=2497754 RepID=UPI00101BD02B|nr:lysylphosphatidylglycerol synthase domain-containing protein [Sphingosinicella sp. CPCC 101087]